MFNFINDALSFSDDYESFLDFLSFDYVDVLDSQDALADYWLDNFEDCPIARYHDNAVLIAELETIAPYVPENEQPMIYDALDALYEESSKIEFALRTYA